MEYVAINAAGAVLRGDALTGSVGTFGYVTSPNAEAIGGFDVPALGRVLRELPAEQLVLSNEGWIHQPHVWAELLPALGISARVVAYVRPQVSFLNSGWWQWGAWSDKGFRPWLDHKLSVSLWGERLARWQHVPAVDDVQVRLLPDDVVPDFFEHALGAHAPTSQGSGVNKGLHASILRLFQRNRELRAGPHASAIDFVLLKELDMTGTAPWVLDRESIERILGATREDNRKLLSMLDPESAARMQADARWWDADAFSDRIVESPDPQPMSADDLEQLSVELTQAVARLSRSREARASS